MNKNVGQKDRVFRLSLAILFIALAFSAGTATVLGKTLLITGLIFALSGLLGFCLAYRLFGASTCESDIKKADKAAKA